MISVNNKQTQTFKGNYERTSNGTPYYKTNSGIKAGGIMAGIGALGTAYTFYQKNYKAGFTSLGMLAAYLGCGAIYDKIRNSKAQKAAEEVRALGIKNALSENKKIEVSRNGHAYYNSNDGWKYGAILGVGVGLAQGLFNVLNKTAWEDYCKKVLETEGQKAGKTGVVAMCALSAALGGMIMGKISDYYSNKDAFKNN